MPIYTCEKCAKTFKQKGHYTRHITRKISCHNAVEMLEQELKTMSINSASGTSVSKQRTFIEVCSGAGGLSCGLINAGFIPLLLNDVNKDCCATLVKNHPGVEVSHKSMENIDVSRFIDKVDLLTGGVPCQSFSQAGKRKGLTDSRGKLMYCFADLVKQVKPKIFMIENVRGLTTHNKGETLRTIISLLNVNNEYNVSVKLLNSLNYGVPQKRERVFIVGVLKKFRKTFRYPLPSVSKHLVLRDVLENVPASPHVEYSEEKKLLFKKIPPGGCWVNLKVEEQKKYMGNSFFSGGGKRGILRRMSYDEPSLTLLCSPTQKQTERCHPEEVRPFTIREYARIQTFPDNYEFVGSIRSVYKQIGNAVPVNLANHMGIKLLEYLNLIGDSDSDSN